MNFLKKLLGLPIVEHFVNDCGDCPFSRYRGGPYVCWLTSNSIPLGETVPSWCPLRQADQLVRLDPRKTT